MYEKITIFQNLHNSGVSADAKAERLTIINLGPHSQNILKPRVAPNWPSQEKLLKIQYPTRNPTFLVKD